MHALPPLLYEVINCAIASTSAVALVICLRYLATEYRNIQGLLRLRLAVAFTVFLFGETTRMSWVWLVRYLANTGHDTYWMGSLPWTVIPVAGSLVSIFGMACVVRALTPAAWGKWGYVMSLGAAVVAISLTQLIRY